MSSPGVIVPTWRLSQYLKTLRVERGWSIDECAYHASLRPADILSLEAGRPCPVKKLCDHLLKLENAYGVNFVNSFKELFSQGPEEGGDTGIVVPFVTPSISIHQNSMEWSRAGVLKDAVELAPHLAVLPQGMIKRFVGRKIPSSFLSYLKQKTQTRVTNSAQSPTALFGHYKRLIEAASRGEYTPPLRYEAKLSGSNNTVTREVTCVKLSTDAYETQTHVISNYKALEQPLVDVACCGEYENCTECYKQSFINAIRRTAG